jgi:hypothetical protein
VGNYGDSDETPGYPRFELSRLDKLIQSDGDDRYLIFTHNPDLKDPFLVENPTLEKCEGASPDPP